MKGSVTARVAAPAGPGFRIDVSAYPFVDVVIERHVEVDLDAYFDEMERVLMRPGPHVLLVDCQRATIPSTTTRRRHLAWNTKHRERIRDRVGGMAFVIPSAVIRGALTALFWMQPLEAPYVVVKTRDEALAACHHWLSRDEPARGKVATHPVR
jgi:hypothetical protein